MSPLMVMRLGNSYEFHAPRPPPRLTHWVPNLGQTTSGVVKTARQVSRSRGKGRARPACGVFEVHESRGGHRKKSDNFRLSISTSLSLSVSAIFFSPSSSFWSQERSGRQCCDAGEEDSASGVACEAAVSLREFSLFSRMTHLRKLSSYR